MLASTLWFIPRTAAQGSDEISFRKHTIDLGPSETVAIVDMNRDGKLDIVSGENWFEQAAPAAPGEGPRWIKHKFRSLPYTDFYLEDLSDLVIDVDGDGYPDIVSCSYWSKPLTWWENPGAHEPALEGAFDRVALSGGVRFPGGYSQYRQAAATFAPVW